MFTVHATAPPMLTRIKQGWEYSTDYFPHNVETIKEARDMAKLAIAQGGRNVHIIKANSNPDSEPEYIPVTEPV